MELRHNVSELFQGLNNRACTRLHTLMPSARKGLPSFGQFLPGWQRQFDP
jgi:hypothetical protein